MKPIFAGAVGVVLALPALLSCNAKPSSVVDQDVPSAVEHTKESDIDCDLYEIAVRDLMLIASPSRDYYLSFNGESILHGMDPPDDFIERLVDLDGNFLPISQAMIDEEQVVRNKTTKAPGVIVAVRITPSDEDGVVNVSAFEYMGRGMLRGFECSAYKQDGKWRLDPLPIRAQIRGCTVGSPL